jgi:hypothetical protein
LRRETLKGDDDEGEETVMGDGSKKIKELKRRFARRRTTTARPTLLEPVKQIVVLSGVSPHATYIDVEPVL